MRQTTYLGLLFLLVVQLNLIAQTDINLKFDRKVENSKIELSDSLSENQGATTNWQFKLGFGVNNDIINLEASYLIPLSKLFLLSLDTRLYNFISFTPSISTSPIKVYNEFSISLKTGLGVIVPGPVAGLEAFTFEVGFQFRYKITNNHTLFLELKQISKSSISEGISTLPPEHFIKNFPIKIISLSIEL